MQRFSYSSHLVAAVVLTIFVSWIGVIAQEKPKAPEAEVKAIEAISSAPDPATKLTQAEAFAKKYPKSTLRPQVVLGLTGDIGRVTDAAQRLALAERFLKTFGTDPDSDRMKGLVVDEYVIA